MTQDFHTNFRIVAACLTGIALCYLVCSLDSKPREHVVTVKVQLTPGTLTPLPVPKTP